MTIKKYFEKFSPNEFLSKPGLKWYTKPKMGLIIRKRATPKEIQEMSKHFKGYIKVVVDVERGILAGGGDRHFDDEKILLMDGSKQENLWGGGFDIETKEIDYNSIINLRPNQENPSRDILSIDIRKKFVEIVRKLLN